VRVFSIWLRDAHRYYWRLQTEKEK